MGSPIAQTRVGGIQKNRRNDEQGHPDARRDQGDKFETRGCV